MAKIGLAVSFPHYPEEELDQRRLALYLAAIRMGGGDPTPLYLDEWEARAAEVVNECDGLVLAGGADLPPHWYSEEPIEAAGLELINPRRPAFENLILADFWEAKKPVLGICYGCQFLNVWRGGGLYQDLELQTGTKTLHRDGAIHDVRLDPSSRLFQIICEEVFEVPSYHHQAVSRLAADAVVTGRSIEDNIIEAIEWREHPFFLGVQWHPERAPQSNATLRLFAAFNDACEADLA